MGRGGPRREEYEDRRERREGYERRRGPPRDDMNTFNRAALINVMCYNQTDGLVSLLAISLNFNSIVRWLNSSTASGLCLYTNGPSIPTLIGMIKGNKFIEIKASHI